LWIRHGRDPEHEPDGIVSVDELQRHFDKGRPPRIRERPFQFPLLRGVIEEAPAKESNAVKQREPAKHLRLFKLPLLPELALFLIKVEHRRLLAKPAGPPLRAEDDSFRSGRDARPVEGERIIREGNFREVGSSTAVCLEIDPGIPRCLFEGAAQQLTEGMHPHGLGLPFRQFRAHRERSPLHGKNRSREQADERHAEHNFHKRETARAPSGSIPLHRLPPPGAGVP
jgi:hypothetical protein